MAEKVVNTTTTEVRNSISSIYAQLLKKKEEAKLEKKRLEQEKKEAKEKEDGESKDDKGNKQYMTKKDKELAAINSWETVINNLTGDDLDYIKPKKNKKKYKKWLNDDTDTSITTDKPAKKKKKNYNKQFDPELRMLKAIVAEQNKFTADLQKRYATMAGPNTRDAMPMNKTLVELASVINNARANSLGVLREVGNIKKTIADLTMKQKKQDFEIGGSGVAEDTDIGLTGADIMRSIHSMNQTSFSPSNPSASDFYQPDPSTYVNSQNLTIPINPPAQAELANDAGNWDPDTWDPKDLGNVSTITESIPHKTVVEFNSNTKEARFKAVRLDNGEELPGCDVPTGGVAEVNLDTKVAKGRFDDIYDVVVVE